MSHIFQAHEGQLETSSYCPITLGNVPVSDFLTCVKRSCDTITVNQLDILGLFKRNLFAIKSEIETCINQLVDREMHLKKSSVPTRDDNSAVNLQPPTGNQSNRSKNIVIHGLNSLRQVKNFELLDKVTEFLSTVLHVSTNVKNVRLIKNSAKCVAVVELDSKMSKGVIFRNCHKLKNYHEKISITDDLSPEERKKQIQATPKCVNKPQKVVEGNLDIPDPTENMNLIGSNGTEAIEAAQIEEQNGEPIGSNGSEAIRGGSESETIHKIQLEEINTEPFGSDETEIIQEIKPEGPNAYFWNSEQAVAKVQELVKFGCKYKFSKLDVRDILRLIVVQNMERLETEPCICDSFMLVQWKRIKEEFGHAIPIKVVKKFKKVMNDIQAIWNENHRDNLKECYCKHFLAAMKDGM